MSPELMMKRKLLPMQGPSGPVAAAISAFVASVTVNAVVTGAIIGAVTSAITGGNILKGALMGGLGGAISSGLGGVMDAAGAATEAAAETAANAMNAPMGGMTGSNSLGGIESVGVSAAEPSAFANTSTVTAQNAAPSAVSQAAAPQSLGSGDQGLINAKADTTLSQGAGKNSGIAPSTKRTGLLESILPSGDEAQAALIQVGGNAMLGQMQGKAQGEMQEAKWAREDEQRKPGTIRIRTFTTQGATA